MTGIGLASRMFLIGASKTTKVQGELCGHIFPHLQHEMHRPKIVISKRDDTE
jgi:hypothetical protein